MKKVELDKTDFEIIKKIVDRQIVDTRIEQDELIAEIEEKRDDLRKAEAKLRTMHLAIAGMQQRSHKLKSYI